MGCNRSLKKFGKTLSVTFWALIISVAAADAMPVLLPVPCLVGVLLLPTLLTLLAMSAKSNAAVAKYCYQASISIDTLFDRIPNNPYAAGLAGRHILYAAFLAEKGDLDGSEQAARLALSVAQKNDDDPSSALDALLVLSHILHERGKGNEASELANKAIALCEKLGQDAPVEIAEKLAVLAPTLRQSGQYEEAERLLVKAIALLEGSEVSAHPAAQFGTLSAALNNLACVYDELSRYQEAANLFRRAYKIKEKVSPHDQISLAQGASNLGYALIFCHQLEEAEQLLSRAQEIIDREKAHEDSFARALQNNRAMLKLKQGHLDEAIQLALDNERKLKTAILPRHNTVVENHWILAMAHRDRGERAESQRRFDVCLAQLHEHKPVNLKMQGKIEAEQAKLQEPNAAPASLAS